MPRNHWGIRWHGSWQCKGRATYILRNTGEAPRTTVGIPCDSNGLPPDRPRIVPVGTLLQASDPRGTGIALLWPTSRDRRRPHSEGRALTGRGSDTPSQHIPTRSPTASTAAFPAPPATPHALPCSRPPRGGSRRRWHTPCYGHGGGNGVTHPAAMAVDHRAFPPTAAVAPGTPRRQSSDDRTRCTVSIRTPTLAASPVAWIVGPSLNGYQSGKHETSESPGALRSAGTIICDALGVNTATTKRNGTAAHAGRAGRALPGAWPTAKILEVLGCRVARAAMGGKPQPIAATVVARLEASGN